MPRPPASLTPLTVERQAWAADPALHQAARKLCWYVSPRQQEDAYAAALLALCWAASRYHPGRGIPWPDYACWVMRNRVRTWLRDQRPLGLRRPARRVTLEPLAEREPPARELPVGWELEAEDAVRALLARTAGPQQQRMLTARYLLADCCEPVELARILGCTINNVHKNCSLGCAAIRASLCAEESR